MFNSVIEELENNKKRRESGQIIAIPWSTFPRLNTVIPGIQQGKYVLVAARTKVGKTQLTDYLFLYEPFEWWYNHRNDTDILPTFKYFSLEMSSKLKWISAISYKLFKSYGIAISPEKLQSVFDKYILGNDIVSIIKSSEFQHWLKLFEERVTFYDTIRNGTGIYKILRDDSFSKGEWTYKTIAWDEGDGKFTNKQVRDKFVYRNPNEYFIDITDNANLLHPEKGGTLYKAISDFSSNYNIDLRNNYNRSPVLIQQLSADGAEAAYTMSGKLVLDKILPTDRDLADNKHTALDVNLMMSLFCPTNYNIEEYEGWDLRRLGDNHRQLIINLNRDGGSKASINLAFLGQCNYFKELPLEPNEKVYKQIELWNKNTI